MRNITVVNSMRVAKTKTMQAIIHWSSLVVYDIGGVIDVRDPNMADNVNIVVNLGDNFKHCRANMKQYQALFDEISKTSLTDWLSNIMDQKDAKKS